VFVHLGIFVLRLSFFSQENKYKEAVGFYEPIVKKHYDNVSVSCKQRRVPLMGNFVKRFPLALGPVQLVAD